MKIAPSLLSCDFSKIGYEVKRMEEAGADYIHLDVMDGHFVPNISFGADIISFARPHTNLTFDVHLMIDNPYDYIDNFVKAGADIITFHVEAKSDIKATINKIKENGVKAGLVIKPKTSYEEVIPFLEDIDMVLIMTVEPGFGGQSFMKDMMPKAVALKEEIAKRGLDVLIEADGGINEDTIEYVSKAGIDVAVSGTGVFKAENATEAIAKLKSICENN